MPGSTTGAGDVVSTLTAKNPVVARNCADLSSTNDGPKLRLSVFFTTVSTGSMVIAVSEAIEAARPMSDQRAKESLRPEVRMLLEMYSS